MNNKDRVYEGQGGGGTDVFWSTSVGGKGGKCVLRVLWLHSSENDSTSNNLSTTLSTLSKPIPIRIH